MIELTDEQIRDILRSIDTGLYDGIREVIAADRAQQSARHAEELLAHEVTCSNLRTELAGHGVPDGWMNAASGAMTDFEATRSIIYDCPALRLPQSFLDRLGMVAQIVVLKGATPEIAKFIVSACNAHTEALAAMKDAQ